MKKQTAYWLILIESVFDALLIGFFLGQNLNQSSVQASQLSRAAYTSETATETAVLPHSRAAEEKVNINTATSEELQTLPGIGPTLAQRIIDYRNEHGPFSNLLELTNVKGIGLERLNKILDYATVGG